VEILVLPDPESVARRAADFIAEIANDAIAARGQFTLATSGGTTPWLMLRQLAQRDIKWEQVQIFQVDERVAPDTDKSRNWVHLREHLLSQVAIPTEQAHPIPVNSDNLANAANSYATTIAAVAGTPAVLDLVHLGLGADGHTASLVPGDPALSCSASDVAVTRPYQGQRRLTFTFPILNRARNVLWVVVGADKKDALSRLLHGDPSIPASRVSDGRATVLADSEAIGTSNRT
jgi:6-phosphogluconolactonase